VTHLEDQEISDLLGVLRPRSEMWSGKLGQIAAVEHHIPTRGPPIASQPYRAGPQFREIIDAEVKRMLDMDVSNRLEVRGRRPWYSFQSPTVLSDSASTLEN
jgi:hypothetical protein